MVDLDELIRIHELLDATAVETVNTSMRIPRNLRDAANELINLTGQDVSVSGLTVDALRERLLHLLQQAALDAHYQAHPEDRPSTVDLARIHARESGHDLTDEQLTTAYERLAATDRDPTMGEVVAYALGAAHGVAV